MAGGAGIGVPPAIHFSKSAITASGSFPEGGICRRGSVYERAFTKRSLTFATPSFLSSTNPLIGAFSADEWQG